jgi:hypothetical protein
MQKLYNQKILNEKLGVQGDSINLQRKAEEFYSALVNAETYFEQIEKSGQYRNHSTRDSHNARKVLQYIKEIKISIKNILEYI